jgi:multicomponent Na+:H+ antiporter subunit F
MGTEDRRMISDIFIIVAVLITLWIALALIRVLLGPTAPDRVVGMDTINTLVIAAMLIFGAAFDEIIYIDVAIVYALLSFVTTLYIAKYLEGGRF